MLPGNAVVLLVIVKHQRMRRVTSLFLGNLAASDLAVGLFCVLQHLCIYLSPEWLIGQVWSSCILIKNEISVQVPQLGNNLKRSKEIHVFSVKARVHFEIKLN